MTITDIQLKSALKTARAYYERERDDYHHHHSFLAVEAMEHAAQKHDVEHYGVEGWAITTQRGVSYLNMGDTYALTLVAITDRWSCKFMVTSWGDLIENNPELEPES